MAKRIAIVEDEAAIRENYAAAFIREGYVVDGYDARRPALDAFESRLPDLVVIDVNLKDDVEGGFELCRELRSRAADLPIIFLTARDSEFDAVSGLRLGADERDNEVARVERHRLAAQHRAGVVVPSAVDELEAPQATHAHVGGLLGALAQGGILGPA